MAAQWGGSGSIHHLHTRQTWHLIKSCKTWLGLSPRDSFCLGCCPPPRHKPNIRILLPCTSPELPVSSTVAMAQAANQKAEALGTENQSPDKATGPALHLLSEGWGVVFPGWFDLSEQMLSGAASQETVTKQSSASPQEPFRRCIPPPV